MIAWALRRATAVCLSTVGANHYVSVSLESYRKHCAIFLDASRVPVITTLIGTDACRAR